MPVSTMTIEERIARVLAGRAASVNAQGEDASASREVDSTWRDYRKDAVAILHTLREPDEAMAAAGDAQVWARMVEAALAEADAAAL